jgi:localization factor PodJL
MLGKRLGAALVVVLLAAGCSVDGFERTAQDAARALDRLFGVDKSSGTATGTATEPAARPAPPVGKAEGLYRAGLAARRADRDETATARFRQAAEQGHAAASYELGRAYAEGRGVPRDLEAGAQWLNLAADRGDPRAQYLVGAALYAGNGVARDRARAAEYLGKAAVQGHADAQYLLAKAFANGQGVPKDPAWAARWYAKAARQGHLEAQFTTGVIHAAGRGLPKDLTAGYTWIVIAAERGHGGAIELRPVLAGRLDDAQRRAAEVRAASFAPRSNTRFADPPTVTYLQMALTRLGYPAGQADGVMGSRTRKAIRAYQKDAGLPADGELTPELLTHLLEESRG